PFLRVESAIPTFGRRARVGIARSADLDVPGGIKQDRHAQSSHGRAGAKPRLTANRIPQRRREFGCSANCARDQAAPLEAAARSASSACLSWRALAPSRRAISARVRPDATERNSTAVTSKLETA